MLAEIEAAHEADRQAALAEEAPVILLDTNHVNGGRNRLKPSAIAGLRCMSFGPLPHARTPTTDTGR